MPVLFLRATPAALLPEPVAAKPEQAGFLYKLALRELRTWLLGEAPWPSYAPPSARSRPYWSSEGPFEDPHHLELSLLGIIFG
jgi:hypothetical protein